MVGHRRSDEKREHDLQKIKVMILDGYDRNEIMAELDISEGCYWRDTAEIRMRAMLDNDEDAAKVAFRGFAKDLEWMITEAKEMHADGKSTDCLRLVGSAHEKLLTTAQSMGFLEETAKKTEVNVTLDITDDMIGEFGDFLAKKMKEK